MVLGMKGRPAAVGRTEGGEVVELEEHQQPQLEHADEQAGSQQRAGRHARHATHPLPPAPLRRPCSIPPGAPSVEVEDWDSGLPVKLSLDATKTAVENAEALYKQVRCFGYWVGWSVVGWAGQWWFAGRGGCVCCSCFCPAHLTPPPSPHPQQARKQRRAVEQVAPLLAAARQELEWLAEAELMLAQMGADASHLGALLEVQVL